MGRKIIGGRRLNEVALMLSLTLPWLLPSTQQAAGQVWTWDLLGNSSGIVAMHMALTHLDTVIIFDQTSSGSSGYPLPNLRPCPLAAASGTGCWAHSMEYDVASNSLRPLTLKTDTWCSSASFLSDGTLQQTGGYGTGNRRIRYLLPCSDHRCDWNQSATLLANRRWYATNQILPDSDGDRVFVVGGRKVFTYEFVPKSHSDEGAHDLPFLRQTNEASEKGNNLYPFIHLSSDGNLFIFANRDSILFDYHRGRVIRTYPRIPGGGARNYPSTGSSVLFPFDYADGFRRAEVMVCGGATAGAYRAARRRKFYPALSSCGRMEITDNDPQWEMEEMPGPRLMSDMILLPTSDILIINGASHGCAGWQKAINPVLTPYLYKPNDITGQRFTILPPSVIARMYHSAALLLADGRILIGGSNPYKKYNFSGDPYPTELRLEALTPYFMDNSFDDRRPLNVSIEINEYDGINYGKEFVVLYELQHSPSPAARTPPEFVVMLPPFVTHSLSMHQRMLKLECSRMEVVGGGTVRAVVRAPPSPVAAPAGFYMLTVVNGGIPSKAAWVRFIH
ncbi:hypothetical protein AXF42_Ash007401 [Apostasia shenzhenica]|uniref:Galactose oxidase n=1 Tax=Apostasia shenzhenica TaxID=1088818 RepID=A0A2I0BA40_9ASPA|nr:hypothetical protein AXF42_Ash007401 [Apostasia shenzhenica]